MKHKKTMTTVVFLLVGLAVLHAQETVPSTGSEATGTGGTASYSVGQIVYTTATGANGSVSQGVQQAYEIFTVGIGETAIDIKLSAYPNPTADNLTLEISDYNNEQLRYQLFGLQGKQLANGQVVAQQTQINMNSLPSATYFVNVSDNKQLVKTFKIIKN